MNKDFTLSKLFSRSTLKAPIVISDGASNTLNMNIKKHLSHHANPVCLGSCSMANSRVDHQNNTHNPGFGFTMRTRDIQAGLYLITNFKTKNITSGSLLKKRYNYSKCSLACREEGPSTHSTKCTNIDFELENGNLTTYKKNTGMCEDEFHLADVNKDGLLTHDEYPGTLETFDASDKNKDGKLTLHEATNLQLGSLACPNTMGSTCIGLHKVTGCFLKDTSYCCTIYDASGCSDSNAVCGSVGSSTHEPCLSGGRGWSRCGTDTTKYRGVNLTAYDNGNLAGGAGATDAGDSDWHGNTCHASGDDTAGCGLCTDAENNTGGWTNAHKNPVISDVTCSPTEAKGESTCQKSYVRAAQFIGGEVKTETGSITGNLYPGSGGGSLISNVLAPIAGETLTEQKSSIYATSYPQLSQIKAAIDAGVNIFRVPFMPVYIYDPSGLTTGWAKLPIYVGGDVDALTPRAYIYVPPGTDYLNYYMTTLNEIIKLGTDVKVIMDCHSYQRWCPTNIPGVSSCLAPDGDREPYLQNQAPSRKYSMDDTADHLCPFSADVDVLGVVFSDRITAAPLETFNDITGNTDKHNRITVNNVGRFGKDAYDEPKGGGNKFNTWKVNSFCKGVTNKATSADDAIAADFSINIIDDHNNVLPTDNCRLDNSNNKCYGPPTTRILGPKCTVAMWHNILKLPFQLMDTAGEKIDGIKIMQDYLKDFSDNIWIGLMNEPNEVEHDALAKTYGLLFVLFKKMGIPNKLLVEGNSWAGLHAQCDPITRGLWHDTYNRRRAEAGFDVTGQTPEEQLQDYADGKLVTEYWRAGDMNRLNDFKHQYGSLDNYFDLSETSDFSTYPCEIIYQGINTQVKLYLPKNPDGTDASIDDFDWTYDIHQYMDLNSTGGSPCSDKGESYVRTVEDMEEFTNLKPFLRWARSKSTPVTAFMSEFGVQIDSTYKCRNKLNLFLNMLEDPAHDDVIIGWTIWRAPPAISWLTANQDAQRLWSNSIIFDASNVDTNFTWAQYAGIYGDPGTPSTTHGGANKNVTGVKYFTDAPVNISVSPNYNGLENAENRDNTALAGALQFAMHELWQLNGESSAVVDWKKYVNPNWVVQ